MLIRVFACRAPKSRSGWSSVPPQVEMMGLIGMGNNPMVGASVAVEKAMA